MTSNTDWGIPNPQAGPWCKSSAWACGWSTTAPRLNRLNCARRLEDQDRNVPNTQLITARATLATQLFQSAESPKGPIPTFPPLTARTLTITLRDPHITIWHRDVSWVSFAVDGCFCRRLVPDPARIPPGSYTN